MTPADFAGRHDIYRLIHKAIRAYMCEMLTAAGRLDPQDAPEVAAFLTGLSGLLALCRAHLEHEDRFVHPALERAEAGAAGATAEDHRHHAQEIATLEAEATALERSIGEARATAAHRLYLRLSAFVAENLHHMLQEEEANNRLLWASYGDPALREVEGAIVAHLTPAEKMSAARWMVPAMRPLERLVFVGALRQNLPPEALRATLALVRPHLSESEWRKLAPALPVNDDLAVGAPARPALAR